MGEGDGGGVGGNRRARGKGDASGGVGRWGGWKKVGGGCLWDKG